MRRFYYISDDLDDLEQIEHELESAVLLDLKSICSATMTWGLKTTM